MTRGLIALAFAGLSHAALAQPADESIAQMQSCLREEGAARQQCIDQLWWELTGDKAPTGPTRSPGGSWVISETQSPVDYSQQISAANLSHAGGENVPTTLTIHCRRQRAELAVSTTGTWKPSSADEFRVAYRINDGPVVEERWAATAGGRAATFKGDALRWLLALPEGGRISFRVFDWQGPAHEATFQLDGLQAVREKIAGACKPLPGTDRASARRR